MAIAVTLLASGNAAATSSPNTAAFAIASNEAAVLIVGIKHNTTTIPDPTITQSGATWTLKGTTHLFDTPSSAIFLKLAFYVSRSTVSSTALNIDLGGFTATNVAWSVTKVTGHYTGGTDTDLLRQTAFADSPGQDTSTSLTVTLGSAFTYTDNVAISALITSAAETLTVPTSWTSLTTQSPSGWRYAAAYRLANDVDADWTNSSVMTSTAGIAEIRAAGDIDADGIRVYSQPTRSVSGSALPTALVFQLLNGVVDAAVSGQSVTLTVQSGGSTASVKTSATTDANGRVTFDTTVLTGGFGNQVLRGTFSGHTVDSANIDLYAASGQTKVVYLVQPTTTASSAAITPAVTGQLQNGSSIKVAVASVNQVIAITLVTGGSGVLSGTLTVATNSWGESVFTGISINPTPTADIFTLDLTSSGLTTATSSSFAVYDGSQSGMALIGDGGLMYFLEDDMISVRLGGTRKLSFLTRNGAGAAVTYSATPTITVYRHSDGTTRAGAVGTILGFTTTKDIVTGFHTLNADFSSNGDAIYQRGDRYSLVISGMTVDGITGVLTKIVVEMDAIEPWQIYGTGTLRSAIAAADPTIALEASSVPSTTTPFGGYFIRLRETGEIMEIQSCTTGATPVATLVQPAQFAVTTLLTYDVIRGYLPPQAGLTNTVNLKYINDILQIGTGVLGDFYRPTGT